MKRLKSFSLLKQKRQIDIGVALLAILFSIFGILMIFESSNVSAFRDFGDKYHYVKEQTIWFILGIGGLLAASIIPYKKYYMVAFPLLLITIILLIAVFVPGIGIKAYGAHRWVGLKSFNFQPSELAKLSLVFYLSAWLSEKEKNKLVPFLLILSLIVGLIILQPDLGTAIILATMAFIMYFLSGARLRNFIFLLPIVCIALSILAISSPYRLRRMTTFLNPNVDPLGASYHIRQILISLGSGGLTGVGLGASRQKYQFLPEANTDSIFAIIGEEFGFFGSFLLILLFIVFLYRIFRIAINASERNGFLVASGIFALFACQIIINLGAMVAILPLTGVPLPFISYGGSNLVISLTSVGIILNISRHAVSKK